MSDKPSGPVQGHYTVVRADAGAFLEGLPSESTDLILTSPPYCIGKEYEQSLSPKDFVAEQQRVLPGMIRSLKPGGSVCWQVGQHVRDNVVVPLDALLYQVVADFPDLLLRNRLIWTFGHGFHAPNRFSGRHETIMWFTKGGSYYFDVDAVRIPQKYPGKKHYKGPKKGKWSSNPLGKNPGDVWDADSDVWDIPNVKSRHVEKTAHPCQFPVALARRLVRALSPAGGLVVDPYMGSGTTGVAALLESREFRGCDLEETYVSLAHCRLDETRDGTVRFRPDRPVLAPDPRTTVAQTPPHFHKRTAAGG